MKTRMTLINFKRMAALLPVVAALSQASAKIELPAFFSDGMVMQQQTQANLWGKATPNRTVTAAPSWDGREYTTTADAQGRWKLSVPTPAAGGPFRIVLSDGEAMTLNDVWSGELWICSGQSNMEMPVKGFMGQPIEHSNRDITLSKNPRIRLFTVKRASALTPQTDVTGQWREATPESTSEFSATAYYFGRLTQEVLDVPVGLIVAAWGGSAAEAWMTEAWLKPFPAARIPRKEADITSKNRTPTVLFNGMLHPLIGISMRGVIWYQGEDNCNRAATYADMLAALINGWRSVWGQGDFPFYYCQIAPYDYSLTIAPGQTPFNSAYLREAQMQVEHRVPNTGMAVLLDAGLEQCIHPSDKRTPGERLAFLALGKTYGIKGIESESPRYQSMEIKGDTVILSFDRAPMGLYARHGRPRLFTLSGEDRVFRPAEARIVRTRIYLRSKEIKKPVAARYGFENVVKGDLYGVNGLPVSSFRTDEWE
jgi:sialate O-acetylesterase